MPKPHLIPVDCDGLPTKPIINQNVEDTAEYLEAMAEPGGEQLLATLASLASLAKRHNFFRNLPASRIND